MAVTDQQVRKLLMEHQKTGSIGTVAPWPRFTISAVILPSTSGTNVGAQPYRPPSFLSTILTLIVLYLLCPFRYYPYRPAPPYDCMLARLAGIRINGCASGQGSPPCAS